MYGHFIEVQLNKRDKYRFVIPLVEETVKLKKRAHLCLPIVIIVFQCTRLCNAYFWITIEYNDKIKPKKKLTTTTTTTTKKHKKKKTNKQQKTTE